MLEGRVPIRRSGKRGIFMSRGTLGMAPTIAAFLLVSPLAGARAQDAAPAPPTPTAAAPAPEEEAAALDALARAVGLTPPQRAEAARILAEARAAFARRLAEGGATRAEVEDLARAAIERADARIRALLDPAQRVRFDRFVRERDEAARAAVDDEDAHHLPEPRRPAKGPVEK
jgi:hypothetical protein